MAMAEAAVKALSAAQSAGLLVPEVAGAAEVEEAAEEWAASVRAETAVTATASLSVPQGEIFSIA